MKFNKVTAIIQECCLQDVEKRLRQISVRGISASKVTGYGEYANYFTQDLTTSHVKIEIFTIEAKVEKIVAAIMEIAHTGTEGDGIIAIQPVEKIFRIRTKSEILPDNF